MIMPALPCDHPWRPLFGETAAPTVPNWQAFQACDECGAIAERKADYRQIVEFAEARRLRLLAAYLMPDAQSVD